MPGAHVDLVESIGKKAAFLNEAVAATGAPATVHHARIERWRQNSPDHVDIVTARALAPLSTLLTMINPFMEKGAKALLHKGQDVDAELTEAAKYWNIDYDAVPSQTDPRGRILVVRRLKRAGKALNEARMSDPFVPSSSPQGDSQPASRAARRSSRAGDRQPEGRGRQDHDCHQSRHRARGGRRESADHRPRSPGQCLDRPRHRARQPAHLDL